MLKNLIKVLSLWVFSVATVNATYVYESGQSLIDLTNETGTTSLAVGDDSVSAAFNLGFTFTFYGEDFTSARMATNGCLHFKASGGYCNDYTPDPLPEITYTLYPFWTDLIRDNNSKVLAKSFSDKTVFGWYDLREYNRSGSDNSFEVILWTNDTFDFRYGALDIINHDVLIGEQGSASESYTYAFFDECSTGTTNVAATCVNYNWNSSSNTFNTLLENGGSLYGLGTGNGIDCSDPLNNTSCAGYDAAYLTQQCGIDSLYNLSCPYYWDAYDDQQCDLDPQYAPFCRGYTQEESVAYYEEEEQFDYGYTDDDMWYDEEYDEWLDPSDPCYENACEGFTDEDWYELDVEQFGQEQVDEWFGTEVEFSSDGTVEWETTTMDSYDDVDVLMDEYDIEQEQLREEEYITFDYIEEELYIEELYSEPVLLAYETIDYELPPLEDILQEHFEHEEHLEVFEEEPIEFLEFETIEELEEWFEEEETEEILEELAESIEDEARDLEDAETVKEEVQDREENIDLVVAENEDKEDNKKAKQLNIVANTIRAASNSVSGTNSGTSIQSTGTSAASGGVLSTTSTAVASSSSGGGISTSNSPSISAQVASSAIQTQQVLSMSTTDVSGGSAIGSQNVAVGISSENTSGDNNTAVGSETVVASTTTTDTSVSSGTSGTDNTAVGDTGQNTISVQNTAVGSMDAEIETAMGEVSTSEADQVADQIVAQNIQDQQEQLEEQQQETGEYADEAQLIAYMGYVQGFDDYRQVELPQADIWYSPKLIYTNINIPDNNAAFIGMYGDSLTGMRDLMNGQPNL